MNRIILDEIKNCLNNTTQGFWSVNGDHLIDNENKKIDKFDDLFFCSNCHDFYIPTLLDYISELEYELINVNTNMDEI